MYQRETTFNWTGARSCLADHARSVFQELANVDEKQIAFSIKASVEMNKASPSGSVSVSVSTRIQRVRNETDRPETFETG